MNTPTPMVMLKVRVAELNRGQAILVLLGNDPDPGFDRLHRESLTPLTLTLNAGYTAAFLSVLPPLEVRLVQRIDYELPLPPDWVIELNAEWRAALEAWAKSLSLAQDTPDTTLGSLDAALHAEVL